MSAAEIKNFTITAKSITNDVCAFGTIQTVTIVDPDIATADRLRRLQKNDILDGIVFKDVLDDGAVDIGTNPSRYEVVSCFIANKEKRRTVRLVLINLTATVNKTPCK